MRAIMSALDEAISVIGGVSKLAAILSETRKTTQSVVSNWRMRGQVPADRCVEIENATGGKVTRHDLRPDIFGPPAGAAKPRARKRAA